jgi:hypothetical protein
MRITALAAAAALALPGLSLSAISVNSDSCEVDSPYSVNITDDALRFERKAKGEDTPSQRIEISDGRLHLDGRELDVSAADARQLREFETEARAIAPEAKALAMDSIDVAFRALQTVGMSFAGSDIEVQERMGEKLATSRILITRRIDDAFSGKDSLGAEQIDSLIGDAVAELMPAIAGEVAAIAVRTALSGDEAAAEAMAERAERMEATLEREIESRAEALGERGEALCARMAALDRIESKLSDDLLDGKPLNLIEVSRR